MCNFAQNLCSSLFELVRKKINLEKCVEIGQYYECQKCDEAAKVKCFFSFWRFVDFLSLLTNHERKTRPPVSNKKFIFFSLSKMVSTNNGPKNQAFPGADGAPKIKRNWKLRIPLYNLSLPWTLTAIWRTQTHLISTYNVMKNI